MEEPEVYDSGGPGRGLLLDRALADARLRVPLDTPMRPDQVRLALRRSGFSVERFALLLGISPDRVHRWARGTAAPQGPERALLLVALLAPDALRRLEVF